MKLITLDKKQEKEASRARVRLMTVVSPFFSSILIRINTYYFTSEEDTYIYRINGNNIWINADIYFHKDSTMEKKMFVLNHIALAVSLLHPIKTNKVPAKNKSMADLASFITCCYLLLWSPDGKAMYVDDIEDIAPYTKILREYYRNVLAAKDLNTFGKIYRHLISVPDSKWTEFAKKFIAAMQSPDNPSESVAAAKAAQFMDTGATTNTIKALIQRIRVSKVDWKKALVDWLNAFAEDEKSFDRYNRRHIANGDVLPSNNSIYNIDEVTCYIDTSGSVSAPELEYIYNEMLELKQTLGCSVELATFNTSILKRYTLSKDDNSIKQLTGRGGTSLACVHDDIKIKESKLKDEAENIYIILSDLQCTPMQKIKGINLVTICTNNPSAKVLGGKLIHVEV